MRVSGPCFRTTLYCSNPIILQASLSKKFKQSRKLGSVMCLKTLAFTLAKFALSRLYYFVTSWLIPSWTLSSALFFKLRAFVSMPVFSASFCCRMRSISSLLCSLNSLFSCSSLYILFCKKENFSRSETGKGIVKVGFADSDRLVKCSS